MILDSWLQTALFAGFPRAKEVEPAHRHELLLQPEVLECSPSPFVTSSVPGPRQQCAPQEYSNPKHELFLLAACLRFLGLCVRTNKVNARPQSISSPHAIHSLEGRNPLNSRRLGEIMSFMHTVPTRQPQAHVMVQNVPIRIPTGEK